jgi:hypothetical protein
MRNRQPIYLAILILAMFGTVWAQSSDQGATLDVGASAGVQSNISASDMSAQAGSLVAEMESTQVRLTALQASARESRDIIKLNCVNDKLLQIKQLLNIAEGARANMVGAINSRDEGSRYHNFTVITVSAEKARSLRDEAEACIGEELVFKGRATIDVVRPDIPDDPTARDPFDLATSGFDIERPTYATPFL